MRVFENIACGRQFPVDEKDYQCFNALVEQNSDSIAAMVDVISSCYPDHADELVVMHGRAALYPNTTCLEG